MALQFNIGDALKTAGAIVAGTLQGKVEAAQDQQEQQQQDFNRQLSIYQFGQGAENRVAETELEAARQAPDPEEKLKAFSAVASRQSQTPFSARNLYSSLPADQRDRLPFPGTTLGTPVPSFPASKGQAGMPGSGQQATPAPGPTAPFASPLGLTMSGGADAPRPLPALQTPAALTPPPSALGLHSALLHAFNQPNAPQPPAGQAPPNATGPSGTGGASPPGPGQGGPNLGAVTNVARAVTAAPIGSALGVEGTQEAGPTVPAPTVAFPDFTLSAGGVGPKDADALAKQIDSQIQVLQKVAPANADQATAQSQMVAQRERFTPAYLRTKEGYEAARTYLTQLLGQTRGLGPQLAAQERDARVAFGQRLDPYLKGQISTGAEAAVDLPQLLREYDQAGVAQGGGRTDANGKPLYVNKLPAVLEAHRDQITAIARRWDAGDREGASQLALDVAHDLKRGWDPKAEAAVTAGLFKLFGNASTALAQDPAFIRGQLQKAGLADRFANVPDGQLGELFFGARADKARLALLGELPRLKGLSPAARQPAIDALAGYSKIADPKAPPIEIDPADFERLTPYEKARVAAGNVRLHLAQDRQADSHQNALSLRALRQVQMARLNALMNDPNAKGAKNGVLTANGQVHVEANLWQHADHALNIWYRQDPRRETDKYEFLNRPENAGIKAYLDSEKINAPEPKLNLQFRPTDDADQLSQTLLKEMGEHHARMRYWAKAQSLGPPGNPLDHFPQPPAVQADQRARAKLPAGGPPLGVAPITGPAGGSAAPPKFDPAAFRYTVEQTVRHGGDRMKAIQYYRAHPEELRPAPAGSR